MGEDPQNPKSFVPRPVQPKFSSLNQPSKAATGLKLKTLAKHRRELVESRVEGFLEALSPQLQAHADAMMSIAESLIPLGKELNLAVRKKDWEHVERVQRALLPLVAANAKAVDRLVPKAVQRVESKVEHSGAVGVVTVADLIARAAAGGHEVLEA